MAEEDRRALTPLIHNHVNSYGSFELDMEKRLPLHEPVAIRISRCGFFLQHIKLQSELVDSVLRKQ